MTENKSNLWPSLLRARQKMTPIPKSAKNPHFGNAYAPLDAIYEHVNPVLWAEGLMLTAASDGVSYHGVMVVHVATGEWHTVRVPLVGLQTMQNVGGALTYAERYGIGVLLALELADDDDGNAASQGKGRAQGVAAPPPAQDRARAQGSARPVSGVKTWDKAPQRAAQGHDDQDAGVVQAIAEAMDAKAAADGKPYRTIKGGKYAITGKNADYLGLKSGAYSAAELAAMGKLSKYRERLEFFAEKDRLQYTVPIFDETPPPMQSQFADAKEADAVVDLTGDDEMPF